MNFEEYNQYFEDYIASVDVIASSLTQDEKKLCFEVANDVSERASDHVANSQSHPMAVVCALSVARNYLFGLAVGNAVKNSGDEPLVLEMGVGTGVNLLTALKLNPRAYGIGIDKNKDVLEFADEMLKDEGVRDRAHLRKGNYLDMKLSHKPVDVVVNENLCFTLAREPLFQAVNAAMKYSHDGTLFVPAGLDLYVADSKNITEASSVEYFGAVPLDTKTKSPILLEKRVECDTETPFLFANLVDFNGNTILGKGAIGRDEIQALGLSTRLAYAGEGRDWKLKIKYDGLRMNRGVSLWKEK